MSAPTFPSIRGRNKPRGLLPTDDPEFLHAPAAVLGHVHVALRIDGDAVRLIELAGIVPLAAKARQDLARGALDDLDARVVLIDDEQQPLLGITRERERHG